MSRVPSALSLLLACAVLMHASNATAQARGAATRKPEIRAQDVQESVESDARSRRLTELDAWLRRLVGRFRVDGTIISGNNRDVRKPKGVMQCFGIGSGPGVHCVLDAGWAPIHDYDRTNSFPSMSESYNTLQPGMLLFALDHEELRLSLMLADDHGIARYWSGVLTAGTAEFTPSEKGCWGPLPSPHCPLALKISNNSNSKVMKIEMIAGVRKGESFGELLLHREP